MRLVTDPAVNLIKHFNAVKLQSFHLLLDYQLTLPI